ncbi:hypothetical protein H2201_007806 [Coniosporium apollinis]|uniref:Ubiquitin 3 binding protein But2 C-terminal domain-containing protein n=1 Tax=Coniosporium apollinis TaxID=61459 RepID=A0ABQ9NKE0_9PEZI|nr:hypothetical protein H2201_007806 [Coniosporium apollinis]
MKFTSSAIAAVLGFTSSVFAAPAGYPNSSSCTTIASISSTCTTTTTTSSTCTPTTATTPTCTPTPPPCRNCPPPTSRHSIEPLAISLYEVWTGAVRYNVDEGKIFKSGQTTDITTLATFKVPAWTEGLTCEFVFELTAAATLTGSKRFQVFTSQKPATADSKSWPSGNLRDHHLGTMEAVKSGKASIVEGPATSAFFPCPAGQTIAGELVGQNDKVDIAWNSKVAGPRIIVHQ